MAAEDQDQEIGKWLAGERSREELEQSVSAEHASAYQAIVDEVDTWSLPPVDKAKGYEKLKQRLATQQKPAAKQVRMNTRWITAVAAAVVLAVVSYVVLGPLSDSMIEVQTAALETKTVYLPDSSKVMLNANSTLAYDPDAWDESRSLTLEGEAYLEVTSGQNFQVITSQASVTVLGTRFRVSERADYLAVQCYEGKVGVHVGEETGMTELTRGMRLCYTSGMPAQIEMHEEEQPSWLGGKATTFSRSPLGAVLASLEAQFGLQLHLAPGVDQNRPYTGSFLHSSPDVALRMVCEPLGLQFAKTAENQYRVFE